jgi:hypothetical protein
MMALFLRRSYEYRHAAVAVFREARAMPMGRERNEARVLARGLRDLARTELGSKADPYLVVNLLRAATPPVSARDMSDHRSKSYDADPVRRVRRVLVLVR